MLIIDDLLTAPVHGLLRIFEKIRDAADEEAHSEADSVMLQLRQLYVELEEGRISEEIFDLKEEELLERLDSLQGSQDRPDDWDEEFGTQNDVGYQDGPPHFG